MFNRFAKFLLGFRRHPLDQVLFIEDSVQEIRLELEEMSFMPIRVGFGSVHLLPSLHDELQHGQIGLHRAFDARTVPEHQLAEVAEHGSVARGNSILGEETEDISEGFMDAVLAVERVFGGNNALCSFGRGVFLLLSLPVVVTIGFFRRDAHHTAAAATGVGEFTTVRFFRGVTHSDLAEKSDSWLVARESWAGQATPHPEIFVRVAG